MHKLRNLATKGVKIFYPGSDSGSKKQITSGIGTSSCRYTRVPPPPISLSQPFEEEIGVGAHDMDYVEAQKNYDIEEENEVDAVNLDEDDENIDDEEQEQPDLWTAMGDANTYIDKLYNHYVDLLDLAVSTNITPHPPEEPSSSKRPTHNEDRRQLINALDWWRNNEAQYPVLSRLARDILNVLMSTAASKSAFSQGRQQLGDNRHSLGSNTMNVLV
ncbi:hypothetical protein FXO38_32650 [Capsicum annuum]|nr:hypothetical protein FXO38_32650 [Capsicum annuum]